MISARLCLITTIFFLSTALNAAESRYLLKKTGYVEFSQISEMSGIVKSRRYDDVYWAHNDSGDFPRIFALNGAGKVIIPGYLQRSYSAELSTEALAEALVEALVEDKGVKQASAQANRKNIWPGNKIEMAANLDWEDISTDGNMLYIADTGNNGNARRDLGVYVVPEPNPAATQDIRALKYLPIAYPGQQQFPARQWHYDNESMFFSDGHIYFITKHRQPGKISGWEKGAVLYRLDTDYTDKYNILTEVQRNENIMLATGADVSPDGQQLAVICYTEVWLFKKPANGDHWLSGDARRLPLDPSQMKTSEAISWVDNETLLLGNEERDLFTLPTSEIPVYRPGK